MDNNEKITFRKEWYESVLALDPDVRLCVYEKIFKYSFVAKDCKNRICDVCDVCDVCDKFQKNAEKKCAKNDVKNTSQNIANIANVANAIFAIIKIQIDSTSEFYKGISKKRSEAGSIGNAKRWGSQNIAKSPETETETEIYKKKIYKRKFFQKTDEEESQENADEKTEVAQSVFLTSGELEKLKANHGDSGASEIVDILSAYKTASGKKYKSDFAAIRLWVVDRWKEKHGVKPTPIPSSDVLEIERSMIHQRNATKDGIIGVIEEIESGEFGDYKNEDEAMGYVRDLMRRYEVSEKEILIRRKELAKKNNNKRQET